MRNITAAYKHTAAALSVVSLWTLALVGAYAQSIATPRVTPGAASTLSTFDSVADVITGNNTKGPYFLAWRKIEQGSESVVVDASRMQRGEDYVIDYANGVVSFAWPVTAGSLVRVSYRIKPSVSEKNDGQMAVPIRLDIAQSEKGGLSIVGLYKEKQSRSADGPGIGVFGISGARKWGNSAETSTLFLTGPGGGSGDQTFWDRSAMRLGTSGCAGKISFNAAFQRAGEEFVGAKEYGLQKGLEVTKAAVGLNPSQRLSAVSSLTRTEDIGGVNKGAATLATEHKVVYSPSKASKITATHTTQDVEQPGGAQISSTADRLRLDQQFGKTSAVAGIEQRTLEGSAGRDTVFAQRLDVNSAPTEALKVKASVARESYQSKGDDTASVVQVVAKPMEKVGVQVDYSARESDFAPDEQAHKVRVEAQPADCLRVSAGVGERLTTGRRDVSREARVEITPYERTTIAGSYIYTESGAGKTTATEVAAASKPAGFVEMAGRYKDRESSFGEKPDTLGVDFALKPVKCVSLFGKYLRNPEDQQGIVLLQDMRSVGLRTQIGSLGLLGGYSVSEDFAVGRETTAREIGLSLKAFGHGEFTTGYRETLTLAGYLYGTKQYTIGYVHNAGSNFNLTIAGTMTQYELDRQLLEGQTKYEAQAKLGLRF